MLERSDKSQEAREVSAMGEKVSKKSINDAELASTMGSRAEIRAADFLQAEHVRRQ